MVKWNPNSLLNAPGNWNPLVYAANDPVNFVDPSGKEVFTAIGTVGAIVGITGVSAYGIERGVLWTSFQAGAIDNTEYDKRIVGLNNGTIMAWNKVYKPLIENTLIFANKFGSFFSVSKAVTNAIKGEDIMLLSNEKSLKFGNTGKLSLPERLWGLGSVFSGAMVSRMTQEMSAGFKLMTEFGWYAADIAIGSTMSVETK